MSTKLIIIYFFFYIYKGKFVILQFTQLKIIQNILTTITSHHSHISINFLQTSTLTYLDQNTLNFLHKFSHFHSPTSSTFHSFTPSNSNKTLISSNKDKIQSFSDILLDFIILHY